VSSFSRDITVQAGSTPGAPHALFVGANTVTISGNILLNQQLRLNNFNNNTGSATLTGTISGAGGINVFFGSWAFWGNNTYQGGTSIDTGSSGAIGVGSDSAFGTGAVSFTAVGGVLRADNGPRTMTNPITLASGAYLGFAGTNNLTLNGNVDLSGAAAPPTLNVMGTATTTLGGVISGGTGGITKNGPGVLVLTGANIYSGTTTVNAGTLIVNSTTGSGTGSGSVAVHPGAILGGSGTVGDGSAVAVTVAAGGVIRPGSSLTGIGTLTVNGTGNVAFAPGSTLQINVGPDPMTGGQLRVLGGTTDLSQLTTTTPMNVYLTGLGTVTAGAPYSLTIISGTNQIMFPAAGFDPGLFSVTADFAMTGLTVLNPGGNTIVLTFTPVPEPGSSLLVAAAAVGLRWRRRARARSAA
jgi:autotransporter-associated beta strand protein